MTGAESQHPAVGQPGEGRADTSAPEVLPWSSPAELIATASHELRQPLASIRGFSEMLLGHWDEFADDDKKEMLRAVFHDALRLSRLVDELLDVGRLESGRLPLSKRDVDLSHLVKRVVGDVKASYPELQAVIDFPSNFPMVTADAFKIEQVLSNIIENACKYGAPGTVKVTASHRGGAAELAISDGGPGIAADELPYVTEKFFRPNNTKANGLGLGLWIAKGIVEAHGGKLAATSVPGKGTTVRFSLPLDGSPANRSQANARSGKLAEP